MLNLKHIDKSWTLFLDRDGVINVEKHGTYVLNVEEFFFLDKADEAIQMLSKIFGLILIATNQRSVAKELLTLDDLHDIHGYMTEEITKVQGRIDKIYYCADMDDNSPNRKPN